MSMLITNFTFTDQNGDDEILTDVVKATLNFGSEIKNNTFRLTLLNPVVDLLSSSPVVYRHKWVSPDTQETVFAVAKSTAGITIPEEAIKAYGAYTDLDPTLDVVNDSFRLFTGFINELKINNTPVENTVELNCLDRSAVLLNKLAIPQAFNVDDDALSTPAIIKRIVRSGVDNTQSNSDSYDGAGVAGKGLQFMVDARLFSDGIVDSGTTDGSTTVNKLIQSGQNFSTTVDVGDWVRNTVDETYAYVTAVDSDTQLSLSKDIMLTGETYQVSDGFIQDTRGDGSSFPNVSFAQINQPLAESIAKLSQPEKLNTVAELDGTPVVKRGARYYIDKSNRLHWYIPSDTPEFLITVGVNTAIAPDVRVHKVLDVALALKVEGNVNFIIFKAGEDMNNIMIKDFDRAQFSGSPIEKDSFRDYSEIARGMKQQELAAGNVVHTKSDEYSFPVSYNPLPDGNIFPTWDTTRATTPVDDATYNASFIVEATRKAKERTQSEFQLLANPRWKGQIQLRGEDIIVGDLIEFTSLEHGISGIKVRVNQVTHSFTAPTAWITSVVVEEDETERL